MTKYSRDKSAKEQISIAGFSGKPSDQDVEDQQSWSPLAIDQDNSDDYYNNRIYSFGMERNSNYLVVRVNCNKDVSYMDITVESIDNNVKSELTWWEIFLIVIGVIIFIILCLWGALTETGRACCAVLLVCLLICKK